MHRKVFPTLIAALVALLIVQLASLGRADDPPPMIAIASWAETPRDLAETAASAEDVVLARVTRVRRGPDLVTRAPGEPDGEDRIPTEIATLQVEKTYKQRGGGPPPTIDVFRTGGRAADGRSVAVLEDPEYRRGERYLLFVKEGPRLGGASSLKRVVSPEGRYRVSRSGTIEPLSRRDWAVSHRGRRLAAFEEAVNREIQRGGPGRQSPGSR